MATIGAMLKALGEDEQQRPYSLLQATLDGGSYLGLPPAWTSVPKY
jgi:hypothetical protein